MNFTIRQRILKVTKETLIGDNSDYVAAFAFDAEWNGKVKIARFIHGNKYFDKLLTDDSCIIPVEVLKSGYVKVGVYSEDITSTYCEVFIKESIKEKFGSPIPSSPDIFAQIIQMINDIADKEVSEEEVNEIIEKYLEDHPITSGITEDQCGQIVAAYVNEHKEELKGDPGEKGEDGADGSGSTELIPNISVKPDINGFYRTDGNISSSTNARRSDYIDVTYYDTLRFKNNITNGGYAVAYFDSEKNLLSDISIIGDSSAKVRTVEIPSNAVYCMVSEYTTSPSDALFSKKDSWASKIEEANNRLSLNDISAFGSFNNFGVVGDSLSVGVFANSKGVQQGRHTSFSWGRQLARRLGTVCLNFGESGVTTKTWWNNAHCRSKLILDDNKCQAYVIGLGANDASSASYGMTIGSIEDIDFDDMNNNADTSFGWYAKIIKLINDTNPLAHIFCFTAPYPRNRTDKQKQMNNCIRTLAADNHFTNVHLIDLDQNFNTYYANSSFIYDDKSAHFDAISYSYIALVSGKVLSDYMLSNRDLFIDIPDIPYGTNQYID